MLLVAVRSWQIINFYLNFTYVEKRNTNITHRVVAKIKMKYMKSPEHCLSLVNTYSYPNSKIKQTKKPVNICYFLKDC